MSPGSRGPVVVDTGVFAARLTPSGSLLAARYRPVLEGRPAVISFVAEITGRPARRLVHDLMTTAPLGVQCQAEDFARRIGGTE
jgi:hypothetical protein